MEIKEKLRDHNERLEMFLADVEAWLDETEPKEEKYGRQKEIRNPKKVHEGRIWRHSREHRRKTPGVED